MVATAWLAPSFARGTALGAEPTFPPGSVTMLAATADGGGLPDGRAYQTAVSGDGSRIAFVSTATNLIASDTNGVADVFVHDFGDDTTTRVSVATDGTESDADSGAPGFLYTIPVAISADGGTVAFMSSATNLVPNDTNGVDDIFVRDIAAGTTTRVSIATDGTEANGSSWSVSLSADGRYAGFVSGATNLTSDAATNGFYVHDIQTGLTELTSLGSDGAPAPIEGPAALSADGQHVAFESIAPGIVPHDTNGTYDVFERDLQTDVTTRVSVTSDGAQSVGNDPDDYAPQGPAISSNGRYVAFASAATNYRPNDTDQDIDVFVHDRHTGTTTQVNAPSGGTLGEGDADYPVISDDGRSVGFYSSNWTLAPCGTNDYGTGYAAFYVRDLANRTTERVSTFSDGVSSSPYTGLNGPVILRFDISGDGQVVSFTSDMALDPADTNGEFDAYVHDLAASVGAPDGSIRFGSAHNEGAGYCNPTPRFQTKRVDVARGESVTFTLTFANLSDSPDRLAILGGAGAPGIGVTYRTGTHDVTPAVLAGTRQTPIMTRGESTTYSLQVHVRSGAKVGDVLEIPIVCSSDARPAVKDTIRAVVSVVR